MPHNAGLCVKRAKSAALEPTLLRGISDRLGPSAPRKRRTGSCRRGDSLSTLCHTHHTRSSSPAQITGRQRQASRNSRAQFRMASIHGCPQARGQLVQSVPHTPHQKQERVRQRQASRSGRAQLCVALPHRFTQHISSSSSSSTAQPERAAAAEEQQQQQPGTALSDSKRRPGGTSTALSSNIRLLHMVTQHTCTGG